MRVILQVENPNLRWNRTWHSSSFRTATRSEESFTRRKETQFPSRGVKKGKVVGSNDGSYCNVGPWSVTVANCAVQCEDCLEVLCGQHFMKVLGCQNSKEVAQGGAQSFHPPWRRILTHGQINSPLRPRFEEKDRDDLDHQLRDAHRVPWHKSDGIFSDSDTWNEALK